MAKSQPSEFNLQVGQSLKSKSGQWYRIVKHLGNGKSASAYLALKTSNSDRGTFYAVKIIREPFKITKVKDFEIEIDALDDLNHPVIMRIDDVGVYNWTGGRHPFYICRYYTETLESRLKTGIDFDLKIAFTIQLLSALKHLAEKSIIHCDIKPANIYISGFDCVLADFGLARFTRDESGRPLGPSLHHYRTPDIVESYRGGSKLTVKSDVYQLGLVVAEMFTGENPCQTAESGLDDVVLSPIPDVEGPLGPRINSAISKMLSNDKTERFEASYLIDIWQGIYFDHIAPNQ
jgi:serine/threonine protein kinase